MEFKANKVSVCNSIRNSTFYRRAHFGFKSISVFLAKNVFIAFAWLHSISECGTFVWFENWLRCDTYCLFCCGVKRLAKANRKFNGKCRWIITKLPVCIRLIYLILFDICNDVLDCFHLPEHPKWAKSIAHSFWFWSKVFFFHRLVSILFTFLPVVLLSRLELLVNFRTSNQYWMQCACR